MTPFFQRMILILSMVTLSGMASGCSKAASEEASAEADSEESEADATVSDRITLSAEALETIGLQYGKAEEREISPSLQVTAELVAVPDRRADIGPRVAGRVVEVKVNVGDKVDSGSPLVVIESDELGRAWADLLAARARTTVGRSSLARQRKLLKEKVTSVRAAEKAEGALRVDEADLQAARTRLSTFGVAASGRAPKNPARVTLTSPIAGEVVARSVFMGQWIEPKDTVVEVIDLDKIWVQASVYERDMRLVTVGKPAQVEVRALPGEVFSGTVAQIDGTLDKGTRTVGVRVALDNPQHRLRPGMYATAQIQGTHDHPKERLLTVPWAAVQQIHGHASVFAKVGEGVFELRRVHVGDRAGDLVEIRNGLSAGEEVVGEGSFVLKGQVMRSTLGEDE